MRWRGASNLLAFAAFGGPMLLALNAPPSPTLLNQCIAIALQGAWIALQGRASTLSGFGRGAGVLPAAVAAYGLALVPAMAAGLPATIALGLLGVLLAAIYASVAASASATGAESVAAFRCLGFALAAAGLLSALIACVQVFAPGLPDGNLVARSTLPGRAVGNLRQPNHLSSLLLWSLICGVLLLELRACTWKVATALCAALALGLVLSGSRTGALGTLLLAAWGLSDRRLSRGSRRILLALPVLTLLIWLCLSAWAHTTGQAFAAETRLVPGNGDISSSRFAIWSNALTMIARNPWTGVGFGEFNFAWTLSAFPNRPTAFFDHTHNLPLQLLVELGIPLGSLVLVLLLTALVHAGRNAWAHEGEEGVARRAAFMLVLMIGLHSMLEYPLWYAYFLLPTAFAWGFALSRSISPDVSPAIATAAALTSRLQFGHRTVTLAGLAMTIGAAFTVLDYRHIVVIYEPPDTAASLEDRIARGQRSSLFGHHADYAAATAFGPPKAPLSPSQDLAFKRAPHQLLDVRLMIAWSQALAAQGQLDKARWLAARIREFRNPGADEYFAPCSDPAQAAQAFQCRPPTREVHWREFTQR